MINQTSRIIALAAVAGLLASLTACQTQHAFTTLTIVSEKPIAGHGGDGTVCPGPYGGYADFINPKDPSGGWYFTNGGKVYDNSPNAANTEVFYYGVPYTNHGCFANAVVRTIAPSKWPYHFIIYFKNAPPPEPYQLMIEPAP